MMKTNTSTIKKQKPKVLTGRGELGRGQVWHMYQYCTQRAALDQIPSTRRGRNTRKEKRIRNREYREG